MMSGGIISENAGKVESRSKGFEEGKLYFLSSTT